MPSRSSILGDMSDMIYESKTQSTLFTKSLLNKTKMIDDEAWNCYQLIESFAVSHKISNGSCQVNATTVFIDM